VSRQDPVRAFFETDAYLERNAIIPVRAQIVADLLAGVHDARILDLGCGDGSISRSLLASGNRLTLVDFSEAMLERARAGAPTGAEVEFVQADVLEYAPSQPYDAVLCVGVLAHVPDVGQVIARAADALVPGGLCVLQTTDNGAPLGRLLNHYYRRQQGAGYRFNTLTLAELGSRAAEQGLIQTGVRRYGLLLPGIGRLPYSWERGLEEAVASGPRLSRLGGEVLVSFEKRPTGAGH
jgi:SAM-dependent methyltransferase